ncbi:unnamed protein product [Rotaria sp. Silwood1]|nr:unnamed protein product [Rotaria sp. Silwood1]
MMAEHSAVRGAMKALVSLASRSDICLRNSRGRGVGTALITKCNANEEQSGALCYPKCSEGYKAIRCCLCRKNECPPEYTDDGIAACIKPKACGRGTGYGWKFSDGFNSCGMFKRCEADHDAGNCKQSGAVVYPKCKSGFQPIGCCICSPSCPDGMTDLGISCTKLVYSL